MVMRISITSIYLDLKAPVSTVRFPDGPSVDLQSVPWYLTENYLEEKNSYPAQKVVWGNSTLFNCESNPECPRDEIYAMTNKLVSKGQEGKTVSWKVQKEFIDKFEPLPYSVIF